MTGRGQANVLTRATSILAALFFATSLGLTIVANAERSHESIFEGVTPPPGTSAPTSQGTVLQQLQRSSSSTHPDRQPSQPPRSQ